MSESLINKIKYAISTKFGGDSSDWENISETKKDIFTVREFKNKNKNEIKTSIIGWKDEEYELRWYFKEDKYTFSIYSPEHRISDILYTDIKYLDENAYVIFFSAKNDPYSFEWSVDDYLTTFQNLSDDYFEEEENDFKYCGDKCDTLDEVIDDLTSLGFEYIRN